MYISGAPLLLFGRVIWPSFHASPKKFKNAALFLRLCPASTRIRHENGAFLKRAKNVREGLESAGLSFSCGVLRGRSLNSSRNDRLLARRSQNAGKPNTGFPTYWLKRIQLNEASFRGFQNLTNWSHTDLTSAFYRDSEYTSSCKNFASTSKRASSPFSNNTSKGQILPALSNWMG